MPILPVKLKPFRSLSSTIDATRTSTPTRTSPSRRRHQSPMSLSPLSRLSRSSPLILLGLLATRAQAQYIGGLVSGGSARMRARSEDRLIARQADSTNTALYVVSHDDFCVYGPKEAQPDKKLWELGQDVVSYCTQDQHNTRLIPDGTLNGVTYVKTPNYIQVSGTGDFTKINISPNDLGAQFDSAQHTPPGAKLFISDDNQSVDNWVTLISSNTFCVRACTGDPAFCPTQYDELGCWFVTGNAVGWDGVWQDCEGDDGPVPGVHDGQTYTVGQGDVPTPTAPPVYNCKAGSSIGSGSGSGGGQTGTPTSSASNDSNGDGDAAQSTAPTTAPTTGSGTDDSLDGQTASGAGSQSSTSWVAVQTCTPCGGGATPSKSASDAASPTDTGSASASSSESATGAGSATLLPTAISAPVGGTTQVGMTQVGITQIGMTQVGALQVSSTPGYSTAKSQSQPTSPPSASASVDGDLLAKRDGETVTKDGQCCFTTWTPSVVGGPTSTSGAFGLTSGTGTNSGGPRSATGGSAGVTSNSGSTASASAGASGTSNHGTSASASGTASTTGVLGSGNTTSGSIGTGANSTHANATSTSAHPTLGGNTTVGGVNGTGNISGNGTNGTSGAMGRFDGIAFSRSILGGGWSVELGVVMGGLGVVLGGWSLL